MRWSEVADYVRVLRALLRGEEAQWAGAAIQMLHTPGFGASRPLDVPILIAAGGPKGTAVAKELADGVFSAFTPHPEAPSFTPWRALLILGTVFDDGEDLTSPRVAAALGPFAAVLYHAASTRRAPKRSTPFPVGEPGVSRPKRSPRPHGTSPCTQVILLNQTSETAGTSTI